MDPYGKNLIRFNDEVNHVKSERRRKPNPVGGVVKPRNYQLLPRDTSTDINNNPLAVRRKGAQSLYTNGDPLHIEGARNGRIESNYTTRSGDRLAGVVGTPKQNEWGS